MLFMPVNLVTKKKVDFVIPLADLVILVLLLNASKTALKTSMKMEITAVNLNHMIEALAILVRKIVSEKILMDVRRIICYSILNERKISTL